MAWLWLVALWIAAVVAAACGAALSWSLLKTRFRRQLESAEAKWHLQHQQNNPGTVIEIVTLGWMNLILQSLWAPVLEKHVAGLTTELLQKVFAEVLTKGADKAPWKFLDSIEVEELSFGSLPPSFHVAKATYDPVANMLAITMDVSFTTESAQAVLLARSKGVGLLAPVTVRLEVTHVKLRGRLRLALALGPEAPGIQGVFYSFTSVPHLDVAVRPLGLPLPSMMPGVDTALRNVLRQLLNKRLVEPQRRYVDVHRIYLNKHIVRVGGPGGLLRLVVVCVQGLGPSGQQDQQAAGAPGRRPSKSWAHGGAAPTNNPSSPSAKLSSYCEVRWGDDVLRTPIVHHISSADAVWSWQFSLALPHELSSWPGTPAAGAAAEGGVGAGAGPRRSSLASGERSDMLSFVVYDAQTVGQPVLLGKNKVSVCSLQLQPNGAARTLVLPLHKAHSGNAKLQLSLQWLKSTKPMPAQPPLKLRKAQQMGQRAPVGAAAQQPEQQAAATDYADAKQQAAAALAITPAAKSVGWHEKAQLRMKSATSSAKQSLKQLRMSSLPATADMRSHQQEERQTLQLQQQQAGGPGAAGGDRFTGAAAGGGGPWGAAATPTPSDEATSSAAEDSASDVAQLAPKAVPTAGHGGEAGSTARPATAAPSAPSSTPATTAAGGLHETDSSSGWLHSLSTVGGLASFTGLTGLSSWLWPRSSGAAPEYSAATSAAASRAVTPAAAGRSASAGGCPWPEEAASSAASEEEPYSWSGPNSPDVAVNAGSLSSSPLALLSQVVQMQKELEQQRAQVEAMQQQLHHTNNSYQRLKQVCRLRGRAALLQGTRFLLHKADGSTQHVLLYLTHAGSSRGGQPSRLGRQQAQPHAERDHTLVIAALPETRREARMAFRRLAAGPGDSVLAAAAAAGALGDAAQQNSAGGALGSTLSTAGGGSAAGGTGPRLSAFGSVGAGLRLRLQRGTMLQMGYESGKFPRSVLQVLKAVPAGQLVGVVRGNMHFVVPGSNGGSMGGSSMLSGTHAAECFTLLVQEDGGSGITAINLQLPPVGNGRCLDEWILALRDVAVEPTAAGVPATATSSAAAMAAASAAATGGGAASPDGLQRSRAAGETRSARVSSTPDPWAGQHSSSAGTAAGVQTSSEGQLLTAGPQQLHSAGLPAGAAGFTGGAETVVRSDSNSQHALEARDWLLPSAATSIPRPWAGAAVTDSGVEDHDNSSSDGSDSSEPELP